jgi:hypothetical protein
MIKPRSPVTRRRFLQGACSALVAVPALEGLLSSSPASAAEPLPRLLVYYFPNGRRPEWWVPNATAEGLVFPAQASALQPFAHRALSLVGLDNTAARQSPGAAHAMGTGTVMTGTTIPDLVGLKNNVSLDQLVARELDPPTRFNSLQWSSGEPGPCDVGGASCAYTQSISWSGPGSPLIPTIDPAAAFNRLFTSAADGLRGEAGEIRKRSLGSVLDLVRDDATALEARLGQADRRRLEEYFTSMRELERSFEPSGASCAVPLEGPSTSLPYPDRVLAFHELIRLAFLCDQTRVLSFMIEFGLSGRSHDFLEAPGAHHGLSHFGNDVDYRRLEVVETWHARQLGDMLQRLVDTPTSDGRTLLDETLVLAIPSMGEGNGHNHAANCPILFGGQSIVQTTGQQVAVPGTPLANLHASLLACYGIDGRFGAGDAIFGDDGNATIPGVSVA